MMVMILISYLLCDLCQAICQHAGGKEDLDPDKYTQQQLEKTYWLCIFAINQHVSICHESWLRCSCGREKYPAGHQLCEVDKFEEVMRGMKHHAVAMDVKLTTFTRVWVLLEMHTAVMMRMQTQYFGAESEEAMDLLSIPSAEDAEASVADDNARIIAKVRQAMMMAAAHGEVELLQELI